MFGRLVWPHPKLCVCDSSKLEWFNPTCCHISALSILQLWKADQTGLLCLGRELVWVYAWQQHRQCGASGQILFLLPVGILMGWAGDWHHPWHLWALVLGCDCTGLWWVPRSWAAVSGGVPGVHFICPHWRVTETFSLRQRFIPVLKKIKKRQLNLSLCFLTLWDFFILCHDWGFFELNAENITEHKSS